MRSFRKPLPPAVQYLISFLPLPLPPAVPSPAYPGSHGEQPTPGSYGSPAEPASPSPASPSPASSSPVLPSPALPSPAAPSSPGSYGEQPAPGGYDGGEPASPSQPTQPSQPTGTVSSAAVCSALACMRFGPGGDRLLALPGVLDCPAAPCRLPAIGCPEGCGGHGACFSPSGSCTCFEVRLGGWEAGRGLQGECHGPGKPAKTYPSPSRRATPARPAKPASQAG